MPKARLAAIVQTKARASSTKIATRVQRSKVAFARDMINVMAKYPPQQPTKYRRTGRLAKGWLSRFPDALSVEVFNKVPYAPYVQGPKDGSVRQTKVMRKRGWQNITDEAATVIARHEGLFAVAVGMVD